MQHNRPEQWLGVVAYKLAVLSGGLGDPVALPSVPAQLLAEQVSVSAAVHGLDVRLANAKHACVSLVE